MSDPLTARARALIARHLHSVEQLEVLLLLRAAPDRTWTADDVGRALVSAPETAEMRLKDLEHRRLIVRSGEGWVYGPSSEAAAAINDVAEAYATRRVTVVGLIFSKPSEGVRHFSDAFRLRRDD